MVVPAGIVFAKPASLSWDEAAALPMAGLTAWRAVVRRGKVPVRLLFWRQLDVRGSSMGSTQEFAAPLDHVAQASWRPAIDRVYPLEEAVAAYQRLDAPHFGNILLDLG